MNLPENVDLEIIEDRINVFEDGRMAYSLTGDDRWQILEHLYSGKYEK